jgi:hypothetical protein
MSGATVLAGRRARETVTVMTAEVLAQQQSLSAAPRSSARCAVIGGGDMLPPRVIEIRRGSAHCLAPAASTELALLPTSTDDRDVGHCALLTQRDEEAHPVVERVA